MRAHNQWKNVALVAGLCLSGVFAGGCNHDGTGDDEILPTDGGDEEGIVARDEPTETVGDNTPESAEETPTEPPPGEYSCHNDQDGDGHYSILCGGDDCDDFDPNRYPGRSEVCDFEDNDCDDQVNDGIDCTFYAHSPTDLYLVDPFSGTAEKMFPVPLGLTDFDTHPDGTLYGITSSGLYRFDPSHTVWVAVAQLSISTNSNGFTIDNGGRAYLTSETSLYGVGLETGAVELLGNTGFNSAGDCVVNKGNTMFMTALDSGNGNALIRINNDYTGTKVGNIGFNAVFGLTSAWGYLFGLTQNGRLINIDPDTGAGTAMTVFMDDGAPIIFWGAASSPGR